MGRLLATLWLALLPSCLELEHSVVIRADGSGTQRVVLGMTDGVMEAVHRSTPAVNHRERVDPLAVFDRELVGRELAERGLELTTHRTWTERRRRFVDVQAGFGGLDELRNSPLAGSRAEWVVLPGEGRWQGMLRLIFYPQGRQAWQQAREQVAEMKLRGDPVVQSLFERRREQVKGLSVRLRLEVPGDIAWAHNLKVAGPRLVTAHISGDAVRTPEDLVQVLSPRFEVIFDGSGCEWQPR